MADGKSDIPLTSLKEWERLDGESADMRSCGRHGDIYGTPEGDATAARVWSCHHRLCPFCEFLRAVDRRKIVLEVSERFSEEVDNHLLTLTLPNCAADPDELSRTIFLLKTCWEQLKNRYLVTRERDFVFDEPGKKPKNGKSEKPAHVGWRKIWREIPRTAGYIATIEITTSGDGTIHPHLHVMVSMPKGDKMPWRSEYHRVQDRRSGIWYTPISENETCYMIGRTADSRRLPIWLWKGDAVRESEESFVERIRGDLETIQGAWLEISGAYIADVRKAKSRFEVVKYLTKPKLGTVATDRQLYAVWRATSRLHRWTTAGIYRRYETVLEEPPEEKPAGVSLGSWRSHLLNENPAVRARAVDLISACKRAPYGPDELKRYYTSGHDSGPPRYVAYRSRPQRL